MRTKIGDSVRCTFVSYAHTHTRRVVVDVLSVFLRLVCTFVSMQFDAIRTANGIWYFFFFVAMRKMRRLC